MGLSNSSQRRANRSTNTKMPAGTPKSFYLVLGGPKIKYIKEPAWKGPLIYNVRLGGDQQGPEQVERADTVKNYFRISHKNGGIKLRAVHPTDVSKGGFELSFIIDGTQDMTCQVDVFVGAKLELKKGHGLMISRAADGSNVPEGANSKQGSSHLGAHPTAQSSKQYHICRQDGVLADAGGLEFTCDEPIMLQDLLDDDLPDRVPQWQPPDFAASAREDRKAASYVPIVVQVSYAVDVDLGKDGGEGDDPSSGDLKSPMTNTEPSTPGTEFNDSLPKPRSNPKSSSGAGGRTQVGQKFVTCLLFKPKDLIDKAKKVHAEDPKSDVSLNIQNTRNFIQLDGEVYEMNDIFDAADGAVVVPSKDDKKDGGGEGEEGAEGSPTAPAAEEDDDEANLCVVCLTEPKNTIVLPCRHFCLCADCAAQIKHIKGTCPVCRGPLEKLMQR